MGNIKERKEPKKEKEDNINILISTFKLAFAYFVPPFFFLFFLHSHACQDFSPMCILRFLFRLQRQSTYLKRNT